MNNTVAEVWRDIKGYEGLYKISNLGNVLSLNYKLKKIPHVLKAQINSNGYYAVNVYKDRKMKRMSIHRLVAQAFIPNIEYKPCVNHKDGNKLNNNINNLEWSTVSENTKHAYDNNLIKIYNGKEHHNANKYGELNNNSKKVRLINFDEIFGSISEASKKYNVCNTSITSCCRGKRKSAGKFNEEKLVWEYIK